MREASLIGQERDSVRRVVLKVLGIIVAVLLIGLAVVFWVMDETEGISDLVVVNRGRLAIVELSVAGDGGCEKKLPSVASGDSVHFVLKDLCEQDYSARFRRTDGTA